MQWAAVDPENGAVYVLFYDRRDDPENRVATVTLARSTDGGRTFTNHCWSDTRTDATQGCLGDYLGLAAFDGQVVGAWVENVPETPDGGTPQAPGPGEMAVTDDEWPWGPTAVRVGFADFGETLDL
jgi:hypothetical protein